MLSSEMNSGDLHTNARIYLFLGDKGKFSKIIGRVHVQNKTPSPSTICKVSRNTDYVAMSIYGTQRRHQMLLTAEPNQLISNKYSRTSHSFCGFAEQKNSVVKITRRTHRWRAERFYADLCILVCPSKQQY